jgi:hypothetical protein
MAYPDAYLDTPELPDPKVLPQVMVGAASPLWVYFGAAAAGGVAFWWMTQWARPTNLEALFATADAVAAPLAQPVLETAEAVAELPVLAAETLAAPEPVVEVAPEPTPAIEPTPAMEAAPEPAATPVEATPEAAAAPAAETYAWSEPEVTQGFEPEAAPEPQPKPRVRKAAPPTLPE